MVATARRYRVSVVAHASCCRAGAVATFEPVGGVTSPFQHHLVPAPHFPGVGVIPDNYLKLVVQKVTGGFAIEHDASVYSACRCTPHPSDIAITGFFHT